MRTTSFIANQTILKALDYTLAKGGFGANAKLKKSAVELVKELKSTRSVSGRHQQIMTMLKKGTTLKRDQVYFAMPQAEGSLTSGQWPSCRS